MKRSFTLIEILIAAGIFMVIFLITASFVNLAAGGVKSSRTKMLTNDVRGALETINQKMNGANEKADVDNGVIGAGNYHFEIYGFKIYNIFGNDVLAIASTDGISPQCTFIGMNNGYIWTYQNVCSSAVNSLDQVHRLTSSSIKVTTFSFSNKKALRTDNVPYFTLTIEAEDTDAKYKDDNKIKIQTSYTMDYLTIQRLKSL